MPKRIIEITDSLHWEVKVTVDQKVAAVEIERRYEYCLLNYPLGGVVYISDEDPFTTSYRIYINQLGIRQQIISQLSIEAIEQFGVSALLGFHFVETLNDFELESLIFAIKLLIGMVRDDESGLFATNPISEEGKK